MNVFDPPCTDVMLMPDAVFLYLIVMVTDLNTDISGYWLCIVPFMKSSLI